MNNYQHQSQMTFGEFFRTKRIELGMNLRAFCERYNYDPGNISRIERDVLPPSLGETKLTGYASALKIERDSEDWVLFHDLAHTAKGQIPKDLKNNRETINLLPAFFRTMRNKKLDKGKLEKLVEVLSK